MKSLVDSVGAGVIAPPPETLAPVPPSTVVDAFVEAACERVREGKPLRRKLSPWGRVHVDRPLPFVIVYRKPVKREDGGTEALIVGEASYIIASGGRQARAGLTSLLEGIARAQTANFGSFLVVELWSTPDSALPPGHKSWSAGFRIVRPRRSKLSATITSLERALSEVRVKGEFASVEIEDVANVRPPGMPSLITARRAAELGVHIIGLEVQPAFRDPGQTETYPLVHRTLHRGISRALKRKVWLKSGGYILIEHTEALAAIDVNTGRYVGKHNLEETILKTNLEAVKEIAYQIRLRDIGGIIIIDFIDMERKSNQEKVFNALKEALKKDKSKTHALPMSEMGLIQMTRKRTREPLTRILCEPCFYCEGEGYLISRQSICFNIYREILRDTLDLKRGRLTLRVNPEIAEFLHGQENEVITSLERQIGKQIVIYPNPQFHMEEFDILESDQ